jgi:hypothetical protein
MTPSDYSRATPVGLPLDRYGALEGDPQNDFIRIITTRGIEFSQSLCKTTFQGDPGLTFKPGPIPFVLLDLRR